MMRKPSAGSRRAQDGARGAPSASPSGCVRGGRAVTSKSRYVQVRRHPRASRTSLCGSAAARRRRARRAPVRTRLDAEGVGEAAIVAHAGLGRLALKIAEHARDRTAQVAGRRVASGLSGSENLRLGAAGRYDVSSTAPQSFLDHHPLGVVDTRAAASSGRPRPAGALTSTTSHTSSVPHARAAAATSSVVSESRHEVALTRRPRLAQLARIVGHAGADHPAAREVEAGERVRREQKLCASAQPRRLLRHICRRAAVDSIPIHVDAALRFDVVQGVVSGCTSKSPSRTSSPPAGSAAAPGSAASRGLSGDFSDVGAEGRVHVCTSASGPPVSMCAYALMTRAAEHQRRYSRRGSSACDAKTGMRG